MSKFTLKLADSSKYWLRSSVNIDKMENAVVMSNEQLQELIRSIQTVNVTNPVTTGNFAKCQTSDASKIFKSC